MSDKKTSISDPSGLHSVFFVITISTYTIIRLFLQLHPQSRRNKIEKANWLKSKDNMIEREIPGYTLRMQLQRRL